MFRLSSFWQVFTHAVPGGPGFKVASTACFDGLCMGKRHLPIPTPWKPPEAAKQIQKRQPLTRDGSEHLLQVSCALNGLLFLLDNPKPTPPFRIAVRIGLSLWTHVVSSPQHQNLVPDYNLHLLQCDHFLCSQVSFAPKGTLQKMSISPVPPQYLEGVSDVLSKRVCHH